MYIILQNSSDIPSKFGILAMFVSLTYEHSLVHDVCVSAIELVIRCNMLSAIVPVLFAIKLEADI